jgi:hypothetical protein
MSKRELQITAVAAILFVGLAASVDYVLFTAPCEARSTEHVRFVFGTCLLVNEEGLLESAP